jgi:hypothetical protein
MTKLAENNSQGTANIADDRVLATVLVRFTYKDKFGVMGEDIVEISKRDSELAIATFEKNTPKLFGVSSHLYSC